MKYKQISVLTIFFIAVFAVIFKFTYPEAAVTSVATVISLLSLLLALGTNYLINRIKQKGTNHGKP